jgi:hypothetical protein
MKIINEKSAKCRINEENGEENQRIVYEINSSISAGESSENQHQRKPAARRSKNGGVMKYRHNRKMKRHESRKAKALQPA